MEILSVRFRSIGLHTPTITGYPAEEVVGKKIFSFQASQHPLTFPSELLDTLSEGREFQGEACTTRKNGMQYWQSHRIVPIVDDSGVILRILAFMKDITERKRIEESLRERLQFEELLSSLSAQFVKLPCEQVDDAIRTVLQQLLDFFGVDRCGMLRIIPERKVWKVTHIACAPDVATLPVGTELPRAFYPWAYDTLTERRQVLSLSTLDDLPAEAHLDKQTFVEWGIQSTLVIPIVVGESEIHAVGMDALKCKQNWPQELIPRLRLLGEIFVNALIRSQAYQKLCTSEERLIQASSAAGAGLWIMEMTTGCIWATQECRRIFHLTEDGGLNFADFLAVVHPDDRERLERMVTMDLDFKTAESIEYRILLPDGSLRWLVSRGQAAYSGPGRTPSLMGVSIDITERKKMESRIKDQIKEINRLKKRLEEENRMLREEVKAERGFGKIVGSSNVLQYVLFRAKQVAPTDATVLILGETGTGKGLVACAIHEMSKRRKKPMVTVNCAALPGNLIESELFGREKGAFTGAHARQAGRFEIADGGTIFLDEIGEMSIELQVKLLRVLQEGEFERLGGTRTVKVDVRVIAATSRDLKADIATGRFREDLYYRLHVFPISLPPLRIRADDIPQLAQYFVDRYAQKFSKRFAKIAEETMNTLVSYQWPGNVRELEHVIERGVIISQEPDFCLADPLEVQAKAITASQTPSEDLEAVNRAHFLQVLEKSNWKIEGKDGAAQILGLHPSTLRFRIKKLGIKRP
ncbi:MAG: sigma 54-interacting transcriptional regulator [Desulfobulbus sp.]